MLDYGTLPPEINSARMYSGPGAQSAIAAAAAWDALASALESLSRDYAAVIAQLHGQSWSGGTSEAMATAAAPYAAWMMSTGTRAEEAASEARAAVAAYETAFAATVPPTLVIANRTQLAGLIVTNIFGQNTPRIGETEAAYEAMWAQDAAAMYTYALTASAATSLRQFNEPPQSTTVGAQSAQAAAVAKATGAATASPSRSTLSQLMSAVPKQLHSLATAGSSGSSASAGSSALSGFSDFNTVTGPVSLGDGISRTITSGGGFGTGLFRSNLQSIGDAAKAADGAAKAASAAADSGLVRAPVLASVGTATPLGQLSVPPSWAMTNPAVTPVVEAHWLSDTELDGPSWHEAAASNMWNGMPAAGAEPKAGLVSRPTVNNLLRVTPRQFKMPRPSLGG